MSRDAFVVRHKKKPNRLTPKMRSFMFITIIFLTKISFFCFEEILFFTFVITCIRKTHVIKKIISFDPNIEIEMVTQVYV